MMRPSDWPEYICLISMLGFSFKAIGFPDFQSFMVVFVAIALAAYLPPAKKRFRFMWRLTYFQWCLVLWYAYIVNTLTSCHYALIPVAYIGGLFAFYGWHVLAHQRWTGTMYKVHMVHHLHTYPPKQYLSDEHEKTHAFFSYFGICHEGPLYTAILTALVLLGVFFEYVMQHPIEKPELIGVIIGYALFGYLGNELHYSFHIRGHFLEQYQWFLMIRELHWIHHKGDMKKNYMLLNFLLDELYDSKDFSRPVSETQAGTQKARRTIAHED